VIAIGVDNGGMEAFKLGKHTEIGDYWVTSPRDGGFVAIVLVNINHSTNINDNYPLRHTYKIIPYIVWFVAFILCLFLVWKGLANLNLELSLGKALLVSSAVGVAFALLSRIWVSKLKAAHELERARRKIEVTDDLAEGVPFVRKEFREDANPKQELRPVLAAGSELPSKRWEHRREFEFEMVEKVFTKLMIISACFLAFAHGANDVANSVGPLAAIIAITREGVVSLQAAVPVWVLALGAVGIVIGLATWGYKVMETIGTKITQLTPSRGFAANIGAATTIVLASRLGFPISTTHTLVGAVLGVGLARGVQFLNLRVIRDIVLSWIITIPVGALLAIMFYYILRLFFPGG
jgi:PiT family inorganic phosphate transporter